MGNVPMSRTIIAYVEENLGKTVTLEKIAKDLNYSKFYMARVFKEDVGVTIYQYIKRRRLEEAAAKLVATKQPVVEIALEAGYGSQQAFTRAFGFEYGCTPQEYRREKMMVLGHGRVFMGIGRDMASIWQRCREGRKTA